ncbi:MAG: hypothetical protein PVS2B2_27960 [Candidatus Acidiferrum sp.]
MQEHENLEATGAEWLRQRLAQLSRSGTGWGEEVRAIDKELSRVDRDTLNYRGRDTEGLDYLQKYADALRSRKASLVGLVGAGNYPRFRG